MFFTHQCGDNKDAAVAVCDESFRYEISQLDHVDIVDEGKFRLVMVWMEDTRADSIEIRNDRFSRIAILKIMEAALQK